MEIMEMITKIQAKKNQYTLSLNIYTILFLLL